MTITKIDIPEMEARVKSGLVKRFEHPNRKYVGWSYTDKCQYEKAWDEHTLIARGIVTLKDGTVISKPFSKFFNFGEKESEPIPWHEPIIVTEKLDGSLIVVSFYDGEMIVNSKGSFVSEHAEFAKKWINEHMGEWVEVETPNKGETNPRTYLFEAIFKESDENNQKVINYGGREDLTLITVIDRETGNEPDYNSLVNIGKEHGVGIVPRYDFNDINAFISKIKSRKIEEGEGVVLHFTGSNKRVKIKSDEYVRLNRLISHCSPKHILEVLVTGQSVESVYASLPDELYKEIQDMEKEFTEQFSKIERKATAATMTIQFIETRRDQAQMIVSDPELKEISAVIFAMLDGKPTKKIIWDIIKKKNAAESRDVSRPV